jgi:hypothetical protein
MKYITIYYNPFDASSIVSAILEAMDAEENTNYGVTFYATEKYKSTDPVELFNSIKEKVTRRDSYFYYANSCLLATYVTEKSTIDETLSANLRSALVIVGSNLNNQANLQRLIRMIKLNNKRTLRSYSIQGEVFIESNLYVAVINDEEVKRTIMNAYNGEEDGIDFDDDIKNIIVN